MSDKLPEAGIYFGMAEAAYHAVPALSASGIKNLMISPMDYWARSHMNPDYQPEETDALGLGKAYDCRIVEGRAAFYRLYAPALDSDDHQSALRTMDDIRQAITAAGGKPKGATKAALIDQLATLDPGAQVWDRLVEQHAGLHDGKTLLAPKLIRRIEIAAAMIEKHPELCKAFTGGYPQVSIFWVDEETGVPMKSRLDYLKVRAIIDLKTVGNAQGKPFDRAVYYAMASYKYHVQAGVYLEAVEAAKRLIRAGDMTAVNGAVDAKWLQQFVSANEHSFVFCFQQTGIAPVARGYQLQRGSVLQIADLQIRQARETYKRCVETFGDSPWVDVTPIQPFDDLGFPQFISEG